MQACKRASIQSIGPKRSATLGWREAKRQLGLYLLSLNLEVLEARKMLTEAAQEGDEKALEPLGHTLSRR